MLVVIGELDVVSVLVLLMLYMFNVLFVELVM